MTKRFKPESWHASYTHKELAPEEVEFLAQIRSEAIQTASVAELTLRSPCDSNRMTMLGHIRQLNKAQDALTEFRKTKKKT